MTGNNRICRGGKSSFRWPRGLERSSVWDVASLGLGRYAVVGLVQGL